MPTLPSSQNISRQPPTFFLLLFLSSSPTLLPLQQQQVVVWWLCIYVNKLYIYLPIHNVFVFTWIYVCRGGDGINPHNSNNKRKGSVLQVAHFCLRNNTQSVSPTKQKQTTILPYLDINCDITIEFIQLSFTLILSYIIFRKYQEINRSRISILVSEKILTNIFLKLITWLYSATKLMEIWAPESSWTCKSLYLPPSLHTLTHPNEEFVITMMNDLHFRFLYQDTQSLYKNRKGKVLHRLWINEYY